MVTYRALDVVVDVEIDDELLADTVDGLLAPLRSTRAPDVTVTVTVKDQRLSVDGKWKATFEDFDSSLSFIVGIINRASVEHTSLLAIHAGAVSTSDGRCVLMPGGQGAGKTTLTAALVQAGFGYFTDEAAAFGDDHDDIVPYPKPLSLSAASMAALGLNSVAIDEHVGTHISASALHPGPLGQPCPIGWVIFPQYEPRERPRLRPVDRAEAIAEITKHTFTFERQTKKSLARLETITRGARCFRLTTGDLTETVELLKQQFYSSLPQ